MTTTLRLPVDHERLVQLIPERLDELIAGIDRRIGAQVDEILHHPLFQRIERAWRGLYALGAADRAQGS
ncbi:type VI secretion system contractile sheath domain-containing protein [Sorangium sp. So ce887]|uniref:type VI secretion system contractile sheath domain-containing protein n=1 Tax=Sorangium sp. So ce887 TaxID=3133324 RepID=UPI003F5FA937